MSTTPGARDDGDPVARLVAKMGGSALTGGTAASLDAPPARAARSSEAGRVEAEAALLASEAMMAEVQAVAKLGSWETALATMTIRWSRETHRIFETDPDRFVPTHEAFLAFVHPDDRASVEEAFLSSLKEARAQAIEHRIVLGGGRIKHVEERWSLARAPDGTPIRALGTCQDITERKIAELALRESEHRFRQLAENIAEVFWITDVAKRQMLYVSPGYERIWGRSCASLHEWPGDWLDAIHPDDRERVRRSAHELQADMAYSETYRIVRPDGGVRWIRDRASPVRDEAGGVYRAVGMAEDITGRKVAEERIAEQAALLDAANDAIYVENLEDRILFWNKGAERIYGWTTAEAHGRRATELLSRGGSDWTDAWSHLLTSGEWHGELVNLRKDGEQVCTEVSWTLLRTDNGEAKSVLAIGTDVTERKRMEAQFLRAQRLESIGTLAGGIAHDLNNVLAPVMMAIEILKGTAVDEEAASILETLQSSAQRGADLVRQVLSFARGIEGERIIVDVSHLIREIQKIARDTFPRAIVVDVACPSDTWTVVGDPTQLHQVFMNLAVNARDAMPGGGRLKISLENLVVDETYAAMNPEARPGPHVMVKFADTGTGMTREVMDRIFEPFFTTKDVGKGTGLGLATTLAIVKSHGGFVHVDSEPGQGTRFKVCLPAHAGRSAPEHVRSERAPLPRGSGELVLVVDDEPAIRDVARRTLERFGYRVAVASNGAEAVAVYVRMQHDVAVVLTDMAMPIMDGPALIVALRALDPAVRIIGTSGLASEGGVARLAAAGVRHFVPKPYSAETMLETLRNVLDE